MTKNVPICNKHCDIISLAKEVLKITELQTAIPKRKLKTLAKKIITLTESALQDGQNMENRLIEYYDAITGLGFEKK